MAMLDIIFGIILGLITLFVAFICIAAVILCMGFDTREDPKIIDKWKNKTK